MKTEARAKNQGEQMIEVKNPEFQKQHKEKVEAIAKALVAGAHSLFIRPVVNRAGRETNRLPLLSYVNGHNTRYLVVAELSRHYHASMSQVAFAVQHIAAKHLAYIDSILIDTDDVKGLQDIFEEALMKRGDGGIAVASLDTDAKVYIRDLKCPRPLLNKGKNRKPIIAPDWLITGVADDADKEQEAALAAEDD